MSFFSIKLTKLDEVISIEIFPLPSYKSWICEEKHLGRVWKEIGGRKRRSSRRDGDEWDSSNSGREREQDVFKRRGVVSAGSWL